MDQASGLTVAYMMNLMRGSLTDDTRGPTITLCAALASLG
jgi:hypothetical protein